jgi:hypothetical protein
MVHLMMSRVLVLSSTSRAVLPFGVIAEVQGCFPGDSLLNKTVYRDV